MILEPKKGQTPQKSLEAQFNIKNQWNLFPNQTGDILNLKWLKKRNAERYNMSGSSSGSDTLWKPFSPPQILTVALLTCQGRVAAATETKEREWI